MLIDGYEAIPKPPRRKNATDLDCFEMRVKDRHKKSQTPPGRDKNASARFARPTLERARTGRIRFDGTA